MVMQTIMMDAQIIVSFNLDSFVPETDLHSAQEYQCRYAETESYRQTNSVKTEIISQEMDVSIAKLNLDGHVTQFVREFRQHQFLQLQFHQHLLQRTTALVYLDQFLIVQIVYFWYLSLPRLSPI